VRVSKEKDAPVPQTPIVIKEEHHHYHNDYWYPYGRKYLVYPYYYDNIVYGASSGDGLKWSDHPTTKGTSLGDSIMGGSITCSNEGITQWNACMDSAVVPEGLVGSIQNADGSLKSLSASAPIGEVGATVEGGKSDQTFGFTTWNGDLGEASIFTFQLLGMREPDQKEYEEYLKLKQKFEGA
jgi:hypothetical protein